MLAGELLSILSGFLQDQYQIQPKHTTKQNYLYFGLKLWIHVTIEDCTLRLLELFASIRKQRNPWTLNLETEQGVVKFQTCHRPRRTPVDVKTTWSNTILRGQTVLVTLFTASTSAWISRKHINMSARTLLPCSKKSNRGCVHLVISCYNGLQVMRGVKHTEVVHGCILEPDYCKTINHKVFKINCANKAVALCASSQAIKNWRQLNW